jgi:hypothetical protein
MYYLTSRIDQIGVLRSIFEIKTELTEVGENYVIITFIISDSSTSVNNTMNSSTVT